MRLRRRNWVMVMAVVCASPLPRGVAGDTPTPDGADPLIANLKSGNAEVRRGAAIQVRMSDRKVQRKALPALIDRLMNEKDGQVRLTVLDTVTALGPDAATAVPALVHTMRTDYGGQRREELHQDYRAAMALAAVGEPAVEGLRGLLKERKETVRAEAVMGLGRIGPDAAAAILDLAPLLGDKNERIRQEACLALGRIGPAAIELLVAATAGKEAAVRAEAVASLGHLARPDERAHRAVLQGTRDPAAVVRAAALNSLTRFEVPDETLLPVLRENLGHDDETVRRAVVNLLAPRRVLLRQMERELAVLLASDRDGVARYAAFLLGRIGPEAAPVLLVALAHEKARIDPIATALAQIGRPVVGLLEQAVQAPEPRVRRGAALALGQIRPIAPGTAQRLTAGLNDPDREVKAAFLTAIGALGSRDRATVTAVRGVLHDESAEIRIQAIHILAQSAPRDDRLLQDLTVLLDDADPRAQRIAIDTLRAVGPLGRNALPEILGKFKSPHSEVRFAAVELIETHGRAAAAAVPGLIDLLNDPATNVRTISAQTLGRFGKAAQPAFSRLTSLLAAQPVEVREAATATLGSLELDVDVIRPHLAKALRDEQVEVRRAAMRAIQRLGLQGALFIPDLILLAQKRENLRAVERLLRRFERGGPDVRSVPELVKQLDHDQAAVRLLAIKFLGLAGPQAKEAIPALERMQRDPSSEVRKQAESARALIQKGSESRSQRA